MMAGITVEEGRVSKSSRLYRRLTEAGRRELLKLGSKPDLFLKQLHGSHPVFLLEARGKGRRYILKSYLEKGVSASRLLSRLDREYDRLKALELLRACEGKARCVKPICRDREGLFLVEEALKGHDIRRYAAESLCMGGDALYSKLDLLSAFLADLHNLTGTGRQQGSSSIGAELALHASQACGRGALTVGELKEAGQLIRQWCNVAPICKARTALVHGDATVCNFLYRGGRMFALDLERSKYADPAYDLGMMAGELFNEALRLAGNPYKADPYIGHMFRAYARNEADSETCFASLTARNPVYMANSLLRISRNLYYSRDHRRKLGFYALECLRSRLPG